MIEDEDNGEQIICQDGVIYNLNDPLEREYKARIDAEAKIEQTQLIADEDTIMEDVNQDKNNSDQDKDYDIQQPQAKNGPVQQQQQPHQTSVQSQHTNTQQTTQQHSGNNTTALKEDIILIDELFSIDFDKLMQQLDQQKLDLKYYSEKWCVEQLSKQEEKIIDNFKKTTVIDWEMTDIINFPGVLPDYVSKPQLYLIEQYKAKFCLKTITRILLIVIDKVQNVDKKFPQRSR